MRHGTQGAGYVVVANNGSEAVQLARTQPFDLVLMDASDARDGWARRRQEDDSQGPVRIGSGVKPIVAMTAQGHEAGIAKGVWNRGWMII